MFNKNKIKKLESQMWDANFEIKRLKERVGWLLEDKEKRNAREAMLMKHLGLEIIDVRETKIIKRKDA